MLCALLLLTLSQSDVSGAPPLETPATAEGAPATDGPHIDGAERSAGLFTEPRVKAGLVVGRMGMGLLFGGSALSLGGALMVVAAFAGAPAALLVVGAVLLGGSLP